MKNAVLVRMSSDLKQWLEDISKEEGVSVPEYIRKLIAKDKDLLTRPKFNPFIKEERQVAYG